MPRTSDTPAAAPSPKPAIVFHDVRKTFKIRHTNSFKETFIASLKRKEVSSDFHAVNDVSFEVPEGESVALMGRNGSGKSTTLKLLSGVLRPDAGWIRTRGRMAGLLEVGAGFHPDLTGRQNVYLNAAILGMTKEETDARFEQILEFSEIGEFIDTEVKRYSSGMYSRLGFSVAVHTEVDVLLVDEILSVGDAQFREKCNVKMRELQAQGKTMFIVSHNASQVQKLCTRGMVLERGKLVFDGPIDEAVERMRPKKATVAAQEPAEIPVVGPIAELYEKNPQRFGKPTERQRETAANGGGVYQRFEQGIITAHAPEPGAPPLTAGVTKGLFLAAYSRAGGPEGSWGFIISGPAGNLEAFETRTMLFSNGTAGYSIDGGLAFTPNEQID